MLVKDLLMLDGTAWVEIAAATVAYFLLSFLWWGPLFGKRWARHMGMDDMTVSGKEMGRSLAFQVVATFLTAFVFWHITIAFTVDVDAGTVTNPAVAAALEGAVWTWLGFFVPLQLGRLAWEKASWGLVAINAGGQLLGLLAMGLVYALL